MKKIRFSMALLVILVLCFTTNSFCSDNRESEVQDYIGKLHSNNIIVRITAAKLISNSAIASSSLYDAVEKNLLKYLHATNLSKMHIDEASWLCKALASSGDYRYQSTLQKVIDSIDNNKIKRYAKQSLENLDEYSERNKIVNSTALYDEALSPEENRIANMIRADNVNIKRDGAKIVFRSSKSSPEIFNIIEVELLANYAKNSLEHDHVDTISWLCKALASSGDPQYRATLRKISRTSSNWKIQNFAKESLNALPVSE
ncbi:MAG: hypothetical protein ABFS18_03245 [Thermodesulfobacteriota bacterium]